MWSGAKLQIAWTWSRKLHTEASIRQLANAYKDALDGIIRHCTTSSERIPDHGVSQIRDIMIDRRRSNLLVPLQQPSLIHKAWRPLFCIHAANGTVFPYMSLARRLPKHQPVYGLQSSGLEPNEELHSTVEAMAKAYLEEIRKVQPLGPYQLLGWSLGGLVAHEMACQLERIGESIELLVFLDTRFSPLRELHLSDEELDERFSELVPEFLSSN